MSKSVTIIGMTGHVRRNTHRDLNEALQLASRIPPARFGTIEVRPVRELPPRDTGDPS